METKINVILLLAGLFLSSQFVYASSTHEIEEYNDTIEAAQVVERNRHYVDDYLSGNNSSQNVIKGNLSDENDVDWYAVHLPDGEATLHIIKSAGVFEVLDSQSNTFTRETAYYGTGIHGMCVPSSNNYKKTYIKVSGGKGDYSFTIGEANLDMYYRDEQESFFVKKYYSYYFQPTYKLHRNRARLSDYTKSYGINVLNPHNFYIYNSRPLSYKKDGIVYDENYYAVKIKGKDDYYDKHCINWEIRVNKNYFPLF